MPPRQQQQQQQHPGQHQQGQLQQQQQHQMQHQHPHQHQHELHQHELHQHQHMLPQPQHPLPTPGDHLQNYNVPPGAPGGPPFDALLGHSTLYGGPTGLHMQTHMSQGDHQMFPQQRPPSGAGGGGGGGGSAQGTGGPAPQQPMPTPPAFHHSQMPSGGPYGPGTPGNVNMGAGGYFSTPGPGPFDTQQQVQRQMQPGGSAQHPPHAQSQHNMMMPPPPGAMPPMVNPNAQLRPGSGGGDRGGGGPVDQFALGMGMGGLDAGGGQLPAEAYQMSMGQASGSAIALPQLPSKGASDFVKKLFNMLDDELYEPIVSWGANGDTFVVKNMNDFTKHVLPRHFRHSNFASFVRQLNKYDFHKVKSANGSDDMDPMANISASGDQIWEFRHPDFVRGREDLLESVKRKAPTGKKLGKNTGDDREGSPPTAENPSEMANKAAEDYTELKGQVATLTAVQEQMDQHIRGLTMQYQGIIGEMLTFQRNMVQQDQLMQNLIQYLMNMDSERGRGGGQAQLGEGGSSSRQLLNSSDGPFLGPQEARQFIGSYSDVARASFSQMSEITRRVQNARQGFRNNPTASPRASIQDIGNGSGPSSEGTSGTARTSSPKSVTAGTSPEETLTPAGGPSAAEGTITQRRHGFSTGSAPATSPPQTMFLHPPHFNDDGAGEIFNSAAAFGAGPLGSSLEAAGLRVFTVGTLQPREENTQDDFLNLNASGSGGGENRNSVQGSNGGKEAAHGHGHSRNSSPGHLGNGLHVPNLEDLPESMLKLDRRTSIIPGGNGTPGNRSPATLSHGASPQDPESGIPTIPHSPGSNGNASNGSSLLRVRRSTYVPGWAVPPRVLLVDDDAMCRKLSSKFLQVFGCAIDVAVDGVNAVNKMNLEKYDLVLMDIVMPNLDGVSATSLIRQFDPRTPIISMTSNSQPNELLTYMQNGMTDILPKPFTKEGLLNMLEKHLIHLKTVSQMEQIPRQLGLPSLPEGALQTMITSAAGLTPGLSGLMHTHAGPSSGHQPRLTTTSTAGGGAEENEDDKSMNPLATLGFSDSEYIAMLQNFIASGSVSDSGQGEITSSLAQAVGASLGEGQGGARRPSQAVFAGMATPPLGSIPNARKRQSDKMEPPAPLSETGAGVAGVGAESEAAAALAGQLSTISNALGAAGGSRKRQRTIGSG
ncbi:hypothetical protein A4X13_0g967 [Tilletia indica]|uniref:Uncharacterized protein n=1 Tax=Tilletia indica TaxID=43049 RepID=A0A177TI32_9BASI|nr:hypothetical protein A4X13_0g967 [Tilletia indica]